MNTTSSLRRKKMSMETFGSDWKYMKMDSISETRKSNPQLRKRCGVTTGCRISSIDLNMRAPNEAILNELESTLTGIADSSS